MMLLGIELYTKYVAKWNKTQCFEQPALLARCPVTHMITDLSIGCFVDDVQKLIVAGEGETFEQLAARSIAAGEGLQRCLSEGGDGLNKDKSVAALGLRGKGSVAATRHCSAAVAGVWHASSAFEVPGAAGVAIRSFRH